MYTTLSAPIASLCLAGAAFGVTYDEAVDGDLSDNANAPTVIVLDVGSNTVQGDVENSNDLINGDRDFIAFTVPNGTVLTAVTLTDWGTSNRGFVGVNDGLTGFVPSSSTNASFLAGTLVSDTNIGQDVLDLFVTNSVTVNALASSELGPGDYTFVVQQTTNIFQPYALELVLDTVTQPCISDLNGDEVVDLQDLLTVLAQFGNPGSADIDGSGTVDLPDLLQVLADFGTPCP